MDLQEILKITVPDDRVERLRQWIMPDVQGVSRDVEDYLIREQVQYVNIQYARFLAGIKFTERDVDELMEGSIDIHAHGGSEPFERLLLEDDIAIEATKAKMRAIVIKTWFTPSASRNALVQKIVNSWAEQNGMVPVQVFGGVTLNQSVGGINPDAVRRCLGFPGMKYVWMPMIDSYHHRRVVFDDRTGSGVRILTDDGKKVVPPMKEIFKMVIDNDLVLASGHYPHSETRVLVEEALSGGVKRIEIIHPAHIHSKNSLEEMKLLAKMGCKLMLSGLGTTCFPLHETGPVYAARIVKECGADNVVFGSDYGQNFNPSHVVATRWMIKLLLAYGVTKEEIRKVFKETPAKHLGLE